MKRKYWYYKHSHTSRIIFLIAINVLDNFINIPLKFEDKIFGQFNIFFFALFFKIMLEKMSN